MIGKAKLGQYRDDCEDIHPDTIAKYYGTDGIADRYTGEIGCSRLCIRV